MPLFCVAPPYTGGNEPILKSEHLKILISLVEEDNDATLFQLAQRLEAQTQLQVSRICWKTLNH